MEAYEEGATTSALNLSLSDDPKKYSEPDIIFKEALKKQCVLVNLPAETNDALARWMESVNLLDLCKDEGIALYHWYVTDGCYASIRLLEESLQMLDGVLPHILIRNEGRLNGMNFAYLEDEPLYQAITGATNLVCIYDFPVLGSAEQFYLDKYQLTYDAGVASARDGLGVIQAQRIKTFSEQSFAVLDEIFLIDLPAFESKPQPTEDTTKAAKKTKSARGASGSKRKQKGEGDTLPIEGATENGESPDPPSIDVTPGDSKPAEPAATGAA